jgi:alpha-N-arabinofuranosidase
VTSVYSKETNTVYINVVNRHRDKAMATDIFSTSGAFMGKAETKLITVDSLDEPFTFDKQDHYNPVTKEIKLEGNKISCSFPAHSFTQIEAGVKE